MAYKLLCFCLILHLTVIISEKCGYIHLSVSAKNRSIVMNWRYTCSNYPKKLVTYKNKKEVANKIITSNKEEVSHMYTNIGWNHAIFPGNLYPNNANASRATNLCYEYEITALRQCNKIDDNQCLLVNVRWMERSSNFSNLRLGDMYIPGTHRSSAIGSHQHYDLWGQLVFGIRYFDMVIRTVRNKYNKAVFRTIDSSGFLHSQLKLLKTFMEMTKKEVVILDFSGFYGFKCCEDHNLLIKIINNYLGKWLANRDISKHRYGPKLSELWKNNKRIIINYRYAPAVERYKFLWNNILIQNGRKTNTEDLRRHMKETLKDDSYKEIMRGYVAVLDPGTNIDKRELADNVNPELSNWYNFDDYQHRVNIIIVDFFEGSKIHTDAVWLNKNYH